MDTGNVVPDNAGTLVFGSLNAPATVILKPSGGSIGISDSQQAYGGAGNPLSTAVFNVSAQVTLRMAQGEELWASQLASASAQLDWLVTFED